MTQTKISFEENQIEFRKSFEKRNLMRSASMYTEIYEQDEDLKDLTNSSIEDWPE
jgi:hypothetical protein